VGKGKLSKFEEMKTFNNVFQPSFEEVFHKDHRLKNQWAKMYFGNENPIVLELGCGKGEYALGLARRFPERNFIGVDIKGARIWTGAKEAHEANIPNVAFLRTRIEFIDSFFGPAEVEEIWLTFPDPQLKKRRNKKRLTAPRFMNIYRGFLKDGGLIHLKTDNAVLYHYTKDLVHYNELQLEYATEDLHQTGKAEIAGGIMTFYEDQFVSRGMPIHYMRFRLPLNKVIRDRENDFFHKVYQVVRLIPAGRITTYGAIASYLGSPQSARMVGWAMNNSHSQEDYVPAHRVVNRKGQLTGKHHFGGPLVMQELLESEGIAIEDDQILDFSRLLWDPGKELI
jgi:tRNA (guanine-N7-)-methyltransferase